MNLQTAEEKSLGRSIVWMVTFPSILLVLGIYHGVLQTLYRAGILRARAFLGIDYYQGLTLHGVINAIVFTTFFAVAFGNGIVAYYLKRIPRLSILWASFWIMVIGTLMAAVPMLMDRASVLYTFYVPLKAHPSFYIGATLLVVGSWVAFFNWIPLYLRWRRENPDKSTPIAVVGIFTAFIVWLFATAPLAVNMLVLVIPWPLALVPDINVPLSRTLFWFFGHPLVYFWLIPAYVMFYAMMPGMVGGKLYSDRVGRLVFLLLLVFSSPVGLHHQYTEPSIDASWKWFHGLLTFGVAIPSFVTAFTLAASLEYGARKKGGRGLFAWWLKLPLLDSSNWLFPYLFVGLLLFFAGGITGIINASVQMNNLVHNTSWIPGHFHTTVGGPVFLAFTGMSLHLVSTLLGKPVFQRKWAVGVPWIWLLGVTVMSTPMSVNGLMGEPRRTNLGLTYLNPQSPLYQADWQSGATLAAFGGMIMGLSMLIWFVCFFGTLLGKRQNEPALAFPESESLDHGGDAGWLGNFKPWILVAVVLLLISYGPPLVGLSRGTFGNAPAYAPNSPVPER